MGQSKEIQQNLTGLRKFKICFCVILAAMAEVLFLKERPGTGFCLQPTFSFS